MAYQPFEKYSGLLNQRLLGRPNGRPVGVANGMGQRPNVPSNPALGGLRNAPSPVAGILPTGNVAGGGVATRLQSQPSGIDGFSGWASHEGGLSRPMPNAPMQGGFGGLMNQMSSRMPEMSQDMQRTQDLQRQQSLQRRPRAMAGANTILDKYGMSGMRSQLGY